MEAIAIRLEAITTSNKKLLGVSHRYKVKCHDYSEQEATRWRPSAITTSKKKLLGGGHRY